ncbi:TROVE domain-containing protein [Nocardia uniformis]|uniref:TROVE domain-containing protein n=1 Tax=Nocardia uniformis TaxID=53432 RepID=A0A849C4Q5_9NOCA|nr:TROVE domain-containing protein [Nocardia uniformis]NNH69939.1 TROVE domain-containing protein [Nocardia uniformis]
MAKFNIARLRGKVASATAAATSPIRSEQVPSGRTHEGAPGYQRTVRGELFLLAVSNMVGENTFYESGDARDNRYAALVREATAADPEWTARFLRWLRSEANMRSAALVGAAEFTKARLDAAQPGMSRQVVDSVLQRADEPGELIGYWHANYGRALPKPLKRGLADAVRRLYDERSLAKWDSSARAFRFGDVIEIAHPAPLAEKPWQGALFAHAIDRRHNRENAIPDELLTLRARAELLALPVEQRRALFQDADRARDTLRAAGMTWESVAGWLQGPMDAAVWEALIPSMGYMAQLRNLRNWDEAGVSDEVAAKVAARLADPEQVARSRQLPMRFLSAYRAAPSLRWGHALEKALEGSLANVPVLPGRTLVLVDTSGSMDSGFSSDGTLLRWDAAALFGIALAGRCERADIVSFSQATHWQGRDYPDSLVFPMRDHEPVLRAVERWKSDGYFIGAGTDTAGAVERHFAAHDRVVILTDEQGTGGDVGTALPASTPLYTWNLAGYRYGHAPSGSNNRHAFGGLSDSAFTMIPLIEAGARAEWPF